MQKFQEMIVAAEDLLPGDWIGTGETQGRVSFIELISVIAVNADEHRKQWEGFQTTGGVEVYVLSARFIDGKTTIVGRSLVALTGEPFHVTRLAEGSQKTVVLL